MNTKNNTTTHHHPELNLNLPVIDPCPEQPELFNDLPESLSPVEEVAREFNIVTIQDQKSGKWFALIGDKATGESRREAIEELLSLYDLKRPD